MRHFAKIAIGFLLAATACQAPRSPAPILTTGVPGVLGYWLHQVEDQGPVKIKGLTIYAPGLAREFYSQRKFQPAWLRLDQPGPMAENLLKVLQQAEREGLRPEEYHLKDIQSCLRRLKQQAPSAPPDENAVLTAASLDLLLTDAFFLYAEHLLHGRIDPTGLEVKFPGDPEPFPHVAYLEQTLARGRVELGLAGLSMTHPDYVKLKAALAQYRELAGRMGHLALPAAPGLRLGDRDPRRVPMLRVKLGLLGDLPQVTAKDETLFNQQVADGIKRFQERHGLPPSGELDPETLAWLNRPPAQDLAALELNLERWRWMRNLQEQPRYILVNIPAFSLNVIERHRPMLSMRVVVGQTINRTPIFSDALRFIVLNPFWEIPPAILVRDKLYGLRYEADFFERHQIEVLRGWGSNERQVDPKTVEWRKVSLQDLTEKYRFRQSAGPNNPLGRIKFMFPNEFNVYLHDTPSRQLFSAEVRSFSSGCIRLEKPVELAVYCLRDEAFWNARRVKAALAGKVEQKIKLTRPIPIHILYWTAWVDAQGIIHFRRDIYGWDAALQKIWRERMRLPVGTNQGPAGRPDGPAAPGRP
ncbi:MAG: L,D-transpeptidase family protein [candidate division FCPU426 bacterium]